jgi:hypothetical protein
MIAALPHDIRRALTGTGAREGKRANRLLHRPGYCTEDGSPGPRSEPFGRELCDDAEADG